MKRWMCALSGLVLVLLVGCKSLQCPFARTAVRVNCGATEPAVDADGVLWSADQVSGSALELGAVGGTTIERPQIDVGEADAAVVYQSERYSMTSYRFPVPSGSYTLRLHFAETFEGITGPGQRSFSVTVNGAAVLADIDPFKDAEGFAKPLVHEIADVVPVDGVITIGFTAGVQNAEINAIEVIED